MSADKPLDARLAARLVYPLRNSAVTPNHLTTLRLLFGITACDPAEQGELRLEQRRRAVLCGLGPFLDHTDGELARNYRQQEQIRPLLRPDQRCGRGHPAVLSA